MSLNVPSDPQIVNSQSKENKYFLPKCCLIKSGQVKHSDKNYTK